MADAALWVPALGALGAIIGSFLATVAVRWPRGRSVLRGRSACDGCGRTLRAYELVPLLGWAIARGRAMAADDALPLGTLLAIAAYPAWLVMVGSGA